MQPMFPGISGVSAGAGIFVCLFALKAANLEYADYQFTKDFDKLLQIYLDIAKFILTLAAGGIVLVVSATIFRASEPVRPLPWRYVSPLVLLAFTVLYGVLFMMFLARDYEISKRKTDPYTRWLYARNQALGYSAVACFCLGYGWLVYAAVRS